MAKTTPEFQAPSKGRKSATKSKSKSAKKKAPLTKSQMANGKAKSTSRKKKKPVDELKEKSVQELRKVFRNSKDKTLSSVVMSMLVERSAMVGIEVPVSELEVDLYGVSMKHIPRYLHRKMISHEAGVALAYLQNGMNDNQTELLSGRKVVSKEDVIQKLLEIVHESIPLEIKSTS